MAQVPQPTTRIDLSVSFEKANIFGILMPLPLILLLICLYLWRWSTRLLENGISIQVNLISVLEILGFVALGAVLHEAIHGLSWAFLGGMSLRSIRFGFDPKTLSPYAHCTEAIGIRAYRIGGALPGLLVGILPALVAILIGNSWLLGFGLLFTLGAGGDMLVLWLIRKVKPGAMVEDHPTQVGCYVIEPGSKM